MRHSKKQKQTVTSPQARDWTQDSHRRREQSGRSHWMRKRGPKVIFPTAGLGLDGMPEEHIRRCVIFIHTAAIFTSFMFAFYY